MPQAPVFNNFDDDTNIMRPSRQEARVNYSLPSFVPSFASRADTFATTKPYSAPLVNHPHTPPPKTYSPISKSKAAQPSVLKIPAHFLGLVQILEEFRLNGVPRPYRSAVAVKLKGQCYDVYKRAGVIGWKEYAAVAEETGLVVLGGMYGEAWIALHPDWHGRVLY